LTNDLNSNSRSGYRSKRKKTNIVLNSLIIVVLLLIIFVAYNIFATGNDKASPKKESTKTEQTVTENKENTDQKEAEEVTADDENLTDTAAEEEELSEDAATPEDSATTEAETTPEDEEQAEVTEGDSNSNEIKATENSAWQPVGTSQTGEHTPVYDKSSIDWQEMLNAMSYATGLDKGNMTVYWLGRDKSTTNGSFGTVASKDNQQKFNVYLQWVDGQGWKPTKVEDLTQNDE
jgi:cell division protein FtsN